MTKSNVVEIKSNEDIYGRKIKTFIKSFIGSETEFASESDTSCEFYFEDIIKGKRRMRAYYYSESYVLTCWEEKSNGSESYTDDWDTYKKEVSLYLSDNKLWYEKPARESWQYIEGELKDFVREYGAIMLTSKLLKIDYMDDATKAKLLSYLQLDCAIQAAKEQDLIFSGELKKD